METRIYLDHAATTPLCKRVLEEMTPYFTDVFGNADSPHTFGRKAMNGVDLARDTVAELIGAKKNEIYFTSGGTESDNWAILGTARANRTPTRDKIVVCMIEHHAVLSAVERLEKEGFPIVKIPVNERGRVEVNALKEAVDEHTLLVILMAANNETGVKQPIKEAGKIAHEHGALFFTDAVQLAPYERIDVKEIDADLLCFSAHKFYGPKGAGVLYIKNGVKVEKLVGGGEQERGLRGGTLNVPAIVGLAKAYQIACAEMQENNAKLAKLSALLLEGLSSIPEISYNGDRAYALPSVFNVCVNGVENTALLYKMDLQGVCFAAGSACASASVKPSHVLTAMGVSEERAKQSVRISLGKNNTEEEIVRAVACLKNTVETLRNF